MIKIKKATAQFTLGVMFALQILGSQLAWAEAEAEAAEPNIPESAASLGFWQTVTTTGYYSPLLGQEYYVTGSYEGDIRLNGNGTNGADGTEVYPGMLAAPPEYAFGTRILVPGIGTGTVHDRGGAIKSAGVRGNEFDRIDIWFGRGDQALRDALNWGKRTLDVFIYYPDSSVKEEIYIDVYAPVDNFIQNVVFSPLEFPHDIYYGTDSEEVESIQNYLIEWGYLKDANGFYGSDTAQAIFELQVDYGIVNDPDELGAGHFGPATRRKVDEIITAGGPDDEAIILQKGSSLMEKYTDLYDENKPFGGPIQLGNSGETVVKLQEELNKLGFLRLEPSGFFGETTEHAVFKFQQSQGLVNSDNDLGAGFVGPQTRNALNKVMLERFNVKSKLAYQREEVHEGRHVVDLPDALLGIVKEQE